MAQTLALSILNTLIRWTVYPIWVVMFLKRHPSIRKLIIYVTLISMGIAAVFGLVALITLGSTIAQFAFAAVFMIAQFAFLFMFLSSTKNIETVPGDVGLVSFENDYFGNEYLVQSVKQWISLMTAEGKSKLDAMGAEVISGILLEGPPGTGKTLLARCLATDSNAAFIGMSGTDFQAMFIGVGPMKVMRTFSKARQKAKDYGACIIFIDEIDAIGGSRGGVTGDARQGPVAGGMTGGMFGGGGLGVLSKLLTELDGVKEIGLLDEIQNNLRRWMGIPEIKQGIVLTMGATNRPMALDPALTRPGRIDKRIRVDAPDKNSRRQIIEGYLSKIRHDDSVDVLRLTEDTQGVTPAQLASAIQRAAARFAIYDGRDAVSMTDIEKALQEDLVGLANPIADFDPEQRKSVAVHEAGHAVVASILRPEKRITTISIIRRGSGILGYVRDVTETETYALPLSQYSANIQVSLAGHLAVEMILGEPWTGAAGGDFPQIRSMLRALAAYGQFGGIPFQDEVDLFRSPRILKRADDYLRQTIQETRKLLSANQDKLEALTDALLKKEELNSEEVYEILEGGSDAQS